MAGRQVPGVPHLNVVPVNQVESNCTACPWCQCGEDYRQGIVSSCAASCASCRIAGATPAHCQP
eukprot:5627000-Amphidinium_carterae.1